MKTASRVAILLLVTAAAMLPGCIEEPTQAEQDECKAKCETQCPEGGKWELDSDGECSCTCN